MQQYIERGTNVLLSKVSCSKAPDKLLISIAQCDLPLCQGPLLANNGWSFSEGFT